MKLAPSEIEAGESLEIGHGSLAAKAMADGDAVVRLGEQLLVLHHAAPFPQPPEMPNGARPPRFLGVVLPVVRRRLAGIVVPEKVAVGVKKIVTVREGTDGHGILVRKINARVVGHLAAMPAQGKIESAGQ